jgi:hypothetical protein
MYALALPHRKQRLYARAENFGFFFCLNIQAFFAKEALPPD